MDKNKIVTIAPVAVAGILMLAVLAAMSSTNQAFAAKRTELTISVTQTGPAKPIKSGKATLTDVPVKISGRLTSEGSGVAGATIGITCGGSGEAEETCPGRSAVTDSGGHYSTDRTVGGDYEVMIKAMTEHIPNDYEGSNATTTFDYRS